MKNILITTIAAVLLVGCGPSASERALVEASRKGNIEAVKQHLAAGADVNAKVKTGSTPLHFAAGYGRKEIVELLIAEGADVNAKDDTHRWTPLHLAADARHKEVAALLIAKGADVNVKDRWGGTPSRKHPEIADLLRKHGGKTGKELKADSN